MHELSIVLSMVEQIELEAARHPGGSVRSVQVRIGVLAGVDCEALRFAWEIARADTQFSSAELEIEQVPLLARCSLCGEVHEAEIQSLACPVCLTPMQEIISGRELEVRSMEIEE